MTSPSRQPLVTVLLPVYNNEPYLRDAIQSILDQTFKEFEFLIIDDGSTDHSRDTLREFAARDERIRLEMREHAGLATVLNEGLALARGKYVARIDGDDISLPLRLARQVEFLDGHPEVLIVGSRVLLIDPDGAPIAESATETTHEEIDTAHLALEWPMVHPAIMFRRDAIRDLGGYRVQYEALEDLDLFLRTAEHGRLANLPEVLHLYRQHHQSMCHALRDRQNSIREAVYREACARRGLEVNKPSKAFLAPRKSRTAVARRWAWLALEAGHLTTARKHAYDSLRCRPLAPASWRLWFCALRDYSMLVSSCAWHVLAV